MLHTDFADGAALMSGHAHGTTVQHWHYGALAGAAGLRSTLNDLLAFLQQNLKPQDSSLRAALLLTRQAQTGAREDVGLGWNIIEVSGGEQSWPLVWRASRTAGFATFLGYRTDRQQALVLLGSSDVDLSALGMAWLEQRPAPPAPEPPPPVPQALSIDDYPGLYQIRGGGELIVRPAPHGLRAQFRGQFAVALKPVAADVFGSDSYSLAFQREAGKVASAIINQAGTNVQARRLSEHAPTLPHAPLAFSAKAPSDVVGDYRLDAQTLLRIAADGTALMLHVTGRVPLSLQAFATDRYAAADQSCELQVQRDAKGAVTGVVLALAGVDRPAGRVVWTSPPTQ